MRKLRVGIIGDLQSGKSLLTNCLLGRYIATVGDGTATTHMAVTYSFDNSERVEFRNKEGLLQIQDIAKVSQMDVSDEIESMTVYVDSSILKKVSLTDTPGFGYNSRDNNIAEEIIKHLDFAIVVFSNDKAIGGEQSRLYKNIKCLQRYSVPYYAILNCRDSSNNKWYVNHPDNIEIVEENVNILQTYPPLKFPVIYKSIENVNLIWYWSAIHPFGELYNRYYPMLLGYGITDEIVKSGRLKAASNFEIINSIFSMENLQYLELLGEIKKLKNELCPIGTIQTFAFEHIPSGWLYCDGREISVESYPELYAAIGTTFGGDGETGFQLPDLRGRFIRGWCADGQTDSNRIFGSPQDDAIQGHSHKMKYDEKITTSGAGSHMHSVYYNSHKAVTSVGGLGSTADDYSFWEVYGDSTSDRARTKDSGYHYHSITLPKIEVCNPTTESGFNDVKVDKETRPKNIALLFCIKAK